MGLKALCLDDMINSCNLSILFTKQLKAEIKSFPMATNELYKNLLLNNQSIIMGSWVKTIPLAVQIDDSD